MPNSGIQKTFRRMLVRNVVLPLVTGLVSSVIFVGLIKTLVDESQEVQRTGQVISLANNTLRLFIEGETGLRGYALTGKSEFLEPYQLAIGRIPKDLEELKITLAHNNNQVDRVKELENLHKTWNEYAQRIIQLRTENKSAVPVISQGLGKSMMDRARNYFNDLINTEERLRRDRTEAVGTMTQVIIIIMVSISLIISILLALYGRRQMLQLSESYESILKSTQDHNDYLQHQQWLKTGQTELSVAMNSQRNIDDLSNAIINNIAKYLNAHVGTFYLGTNENTFELKGAFAYLPEQSRHQQVLLGETLVGQAALEKRSLKISDVPTDYIKVSSSVGNTKPAELIIFPILDEDHVLGVIELGFLGSNDLKCQDFLRMVNETIAVALKTALFREQREKLLKEIQNQTEELQTQQEELRAMNEELEEQTRILKNTQTRLESQHAEMEQTNSQLEEQARALESQKDLLDRRNDSLVDAKLSLEQKALELQRASQYKSEFLANMSHELRTPLNSSLILAKLLADNKEKNLTRQQMDFAQQILNSGNDLLNLINDILDLSKVESGKLDINPESVPVNSLVSGLKKAFTPMASDKGLNISFEVDEQAPKQIFTDRLRLEQILKNLLSNGIKFTNQGSVVLRVLPGHTRGGTTNKSNGDWIRFEVKDTGIGIKKEHQDVIFEAFRQADGTTNRKFGGTGLGLSISRDLAKLLGGKIVVDSVVDQGSTFALVMPVTYKEALNEAPVEFAPSQEEKIDRAPFINLKAPMKEVEKKTYPQFFADDREQITKNDERYILVVEDDKKFAQILFDLAHEQNYKCIVTDRAEEALEIVEQFLPSAVLLDVKLSDQNGLIVLDQLKSQAETRHIPVHIISAEDFSRQALHLGAMGYILKPVRREQLVEAFEKIESKISQDIRKVLVIEDNKVQREAIQKLIEDKSLETKAAESGAEALKILDTNSFDCMIMDLNLPDMSGFELLEKMNSEPDKKYPPVIVYTGRSLSREEEIQLNKYSRSVIIKGARSPERLLDEVTLFLHRVESNLDKSKQDMLENLRNREKIFENKTVMIVDDDMRNTFALTAALEQKGAKIIIARNGEESLNKLEAETQVDMVLMDIMMPVMDGYEATRRIRKNPKFKKLPIIALTAKAMKDDHQLCLQAGANDYLSKPVDLDKLLSLMRIWLTGGWS